MECCIFFAIALFYVSLFNLGQVFASVDYDIRDILRRKRSLIFPAGSETKIQVLFGLGLPMEGEISMILGYVLKCNYVLPSNSSDFTDASHIRYVRESATRGNLTTRQNGNLTSRPLGQTGVISRWSLYRIFEMAMDSRGSTGKACLLRAICEAAETPFDDPGGALIGQLLHVLLTPSTTNENYDSYDDRQYTAAEAIGASSNGHACRTVFHECLRSPLNYFTT